MEAKNLLPIVSVATAGRLKRQHRSFLNLDLVPPRVELPFPARTPENRLMKLCLPDVIQCSPLSKKLPAASVGDFLCRGSFFPFRSRMRDSENKYSNSTGSFILDPVRAGFQEIQPDRGGLRKG
ncbi:hypothetical protein AVEN_28285-1 [Araneus ventricosus]|uniref:Uncharacterized protein n=1 Tax=Araneus ventricosus TaxID=182803 RepID=A0A4Y2UTV2_ARAVE|nr:hypothetical protein AVEN_28285-1 [Araneus ventricosus]